MIVYSVCDCCRLINVDGPSVYFHFLICSFQFAYNVYVRFLFISCVMIVMGGCVSM